MIAPGQVKRKPGQGSWVLSRHTINGRTLPEGAGGDSRQPMNSWDLLVRGVLPIGWRFESDCHENWANIQCGAGTLLVFGPGAEWPCPQIQRIRIAAKVSACTCCNVVNASAQICVFGGKQNCLQEICGKENILRGGWVRSSFPARWFGARGARSASLERNTEWIGPVMLLSCLGLPLEASMGSIVCGGAEITCKRNCMDSHWLWCRGLDLRWACWNRFKPLGMNPS